jgi:hypothetical protein
VNSINIVQNTTVLHREQYEQLEQYEHFEQMNEFRYILEPYKGLNSRIFSSSKEKSIY